MISSAGDAKRHVYLAAPLFTPSERELNSRLGSMLEKHFNIFLPQRDGTLLPGQVLSQSEFDMVSSEIYRCDTKAIESCDILLAVLDGRVVDEGVAFELGYAAALGKKCIGFRTDSRVLLPGGHNPMIQKCLSDIFLSETQLIAWASGHQE